ncbi:hypothetical protein [Streptomyces sp. NPDC058644]|uniref:hypothetical protein n=1 Tax=unclassified Streptomyces TaxID=2593676 RepID=UPI00364CD231
MGTRAYTDVELARKQLGSRPTEPGSSPQFSSGVSAAYRWALGSADRSPVTGAADSGGVPDLQALTAEVDAAVVQTGDLTRPPGLRDYSRGVHDALAWVCGHTSQAP